MFSYTRVYEYMYILNWFSFFFFFGIVSDFARDACLYIDSVPKRIEFPSLTTIWSSGGGLSILPAAENEKKISGYRFIRRRDDDDDIAWRQ